MTAPLASLMTLALAGLLGAASPESPDPAPNDATARKALEDRLAQEKARLARLQAELKQAEGGGPASGAEPAPKEKPKDAAPRQEQAEAKPKAADPALLQRPSLAAADVLYRLGRYAEARAIYEAAAKEAGAAPEDRVWALLQAGSCARRLRDFDTAIARFQTILAEYPDGPWLKEHVDWALRTAQWEKRWHRQAPESGE